MILSQGAEATIKQEGDKVIKERTPKRYRIQAIDTTMRKSRTKREVKVIEKVRELGVQVPELFMQEAKDDYTIVMSYVDGQRLRDYLFKHEKALDKLTIVGRWLAQLHEATIIHGDLTTSNILIDAQEELTLIDFGLSFFSTKIEDMAVDIHLFEQAIQSTHYKHARTYFEAFLEGYCSFSQAQNVIDRLKTVQARGRNKH